MRNKMSDNNKKLALAIDKAKKTCLHVRDWSRQSKAQYMDLLKLENHELLNELSVNGMNFSVKSFDRMANVIQKQRLALDTALRKVDPPASMSNKPLSKENFKKPEPPESTSSSTSSSSINQVIEITDYSEADSTLEEVNVEAVNISSSADDNQENAITISDSTCSHQQVDFADDVDANGPMAVIIEKSETELDDVAKFRQKSLPSTVVTSLVIQHISSSQSSESFPKPRPVEQILASSSKSCSDLQIDRKIENVFDDTDSSWSASSPRSEGSPIFLNIVKPPPVAKETASSLISEGNPIFVNVVKPPVAKEAESPLEVINSGESCLEPPPFERLLSDLEPSPRSRHSPVELPEESTQVIELTPTAKYYDVSPQRRSTTSLVPLKSPVQVESLICLASSDSESAEVNQPANTSQVKEPEPVEPEPEEQSTSRKASKKRLSEIEPEITDSSESTISSAPSSHEFYSPHDSDIAEDDMKMPGHAEKPKRKSARNQPAKPAPKRFKPLAMFTPVKKTRGVGTSTRQSQRGKQYQSIEESILKANAAKLNIAVQALAPTKRYPGKR